MKTKLLLFLLTFLLTAPAFADLKESREKKPFIPVSKTTAYAVTAGIAVSQKSNLIPTSTLISLTDFESPTAPTQTANALNIYKGDLAEVMMNKVFTSKTLQKTGNWQSLTPTNAGRNGIDGLYIRMNRKGNPIRFMVADAKMNTARLGHTADGKQMSQSWINPRLKRTAKSYQDLGKNLNGAKLQQVRRVPKLFPKKVTNVPIDDLHTAQVWKTSKGYSYYIRGGHQVTPEQLRRQVKVVSQYMNGAASGKIAYQQRLFTYQAVEGKHVFSIQTLDIDGNVIRGTTQKIQGTFKELPKEFSRAIRHAAVRTLGQQKNIYGFRRYNSEELKAIVRKCCDNPEYFNRVCMKPRLTPFEVRGIALTAALTAIFPAIDVAVQLSTTGTVDWKQVGTISFLGGTSTVVGVTTSAGLRTLGYSAHFSNFMGGNIAGALISIGMAAMGYCSPTEALINTSATMTIAGLTAATPVVMMAIATTFGTTASGTAIATLSGAAATNAALAWLGGGSIAAGGAGMAGGAALIGAAATGVGIAAVIGVTVWEAWKYFSDQEHQYEFLNHRMAVEQTKIKTKINQNPAFSKLGTA